MANNLLLIVLALLLVLLNGFFVAAEFGLVKLRQTKVKAMARHHGWRGRLLATVHSHLDAYLSACQLGITLASLGLGWIGEPAFAALLDPLLDGLGIDDPDVVHGIAFFFAFFTISFLHIVVGELAPKSLAIRRPESIGLWTATPLYGFYWLMYPAIWLLNQSANLVLRVVGLDAAHGHDAQYSAEELKMILKSSRANDQFSSEEWRVLTHALDFSELEVADLMRPFSDVVALSAADSLEENLEKIGTHRFSRYPFLDKEGHVKGCIHLKHLLLAHLQGEELDSLNKHIRPVLHVRPGMPARQLFRSFREGAPHFAIVGHRSTPCLGFITLDDLLGALVGEIQDEFHAGGQRRTGEWQRGADGRLYGHGSLSLFSLERALDVEIPCEEAESVGGYIMATLDHVPTEGSVIDTAHCSLEVTRMQGRRITEVAVTPRQSLT